MSEETAAALRAEGFEIIEQIGQGGFAKVYTVKWHQYPDQIFAAKIISLEEKASFACIQSYQDEINMLKNIYHPNIIKVYKHFSSGHDMVIIMEYCPNGTLLDLVLKKGVLNKCDFKVVATQVLDALKECHSNQIAHRDIKPQNVMIDSNKRVQLCDFGIAQVVEDTNIKRYDGSIMFLPPEMLSRVPYDPKKADIWMLGITFYFLVCGAQPFTGKTMSELIRNITIGYAKFPCMISHSITKFISKMIAKDPNSRPTCEELLKDPLFSIAPVNDTGKLIMVNTRSHTLMLGKRSLCKKGKSLSFHSIKTGYTCQVSQTFESMSPLSPKVLSDG